MHFDSEQLASATWVLCFCDPFQENLKRNVNVHMQPCKEYEMTPTVMVTFQFKDDPRL